MTNATNTEALYDHIVTRLEQADGAQHDAWEMLVEDAAKGRLAWAGFEPDDATTPERLYDRIVDITGVEDRGATNTNEAIWTIVESQSECSSYEAAAPWDKAYGTLEAAMAAVQSALQESSDEYPVPTGATQPIVEIEWAEISDGRWVGWVEEFANHVFLTRTTIV